jgi:predicted small metal-binding protein
MPGCEYVAQGQDDSEVMRKAEEHARRDHQMSTIPPEVEEQARGAIRDSDR